MKPHRLSQTVITANEIHVPVGQPVVIKTSSTDVIHSFWAPNLHGKRDLIPGYQNAVRLQVDQPGTYRGQCAEFCGHRHAHMAFFVVAEPLEQFNAWLKHRQVSTASAGRLTVSPTRSSKYFFQHTCVMCHAVRGSESAGTRWA